MISRNQNKDKDMRNVSVGELRQQRVIITHLETRCRRGQPEICHPSP